MAATTAPNHGPARGAQHSWRIRFGVIRAFGSLVLAGLVITLVLGCELFYDAFAHPLTADAGQVITGSVFLSISVLLVVVVIRGRR